MNEKEKDFGVSRRDLITTAITVLLVVLFYLIPPVSPLTREGMITIAAFIGLCIILVRDGDLWCAFVTMIVYALLGQVNISSTLIPEMMSDSVIWMLFFLFWFVAAINGSGLVEWIAMKILSLKIARKGPYFLVAIMFTASFAATAVTQSAGGVVVILMTILLGVAKEMGLEKRSLYTVSTGIGMAISAAMGMLGVPYSISIANMRAFVVSLGGELQDTMIVVLMAWLAWIVYMIAHIAVVKFIFRPKMDTSKLSEYNLSREMPMTSSMKQTLGAILVLVLLMALPSILPSTWFITGYLDLMGTTGPFIVALLIMCFIKRNDGNGYLFNFREKMRDSTSWRILMLSAMIVYLAGLFTGNTELGIMAAIMAVLEPLTAAPAWVFIFVMGLLCTIMTNVSNNILCVLVFSSIGITFFADQPAFMLLYLLCITFAEALAIAFPSGGPIAAVLYANKEGLFETQDIINWGLLLTVIQYLCLFVLLFALQAIWV